ncbi:hypothetical protein PGT21_027362 [Puccinia graminis f. sp. tritici]|uniref:Uncharacterized protein n=1 Tax=Puccinia graminis f. sp. tritici TaxID=56615 RepID=A0A5B0N8J2_PUCGR|nr:hypothetical protein PGT21_027362 [Puccinia graminis f. sp. tritici]
MKRSCGRSRERGVAADLSVLCTPFRSEVTRYGQPNPYQLPPPPNPSADSAFFWRLPSDFRCVGNSFSSIQHLGIQATLDRRSIGNELKPVPFQAKGSSSNRLAKKESRNLFSSSSTSDRLGTPQQESISD